MKKSLIALVAALVLLGTVLFLNKRTETHQSEQHFVFDTTGYKQMGSLFAAKGADTARLNLVDGKWVVSKDQWPVDTSRIHKVSKLLYLFQDGEVVSRNPERASEYGLDTSGAKEISWKDNSGKEVAHLVVGKTSGADYNSTYWKYADKPEVYRTPGNFAWDIYPKDDDWRDRKFYNIAAKDIQFVDVTWKDSTGAAFNYKLEALNDTTWRMLLPAPSNAKKALATEIANRLIEMQVDDFMAPNDSNKTQIALDSPVVVAKVDLRSGKSIEIKGGKTFNYYVYAQHPSRSDTVKISSWRFESLKKKPFELVELDTAKVVSSKDSTVKK